MKKSFIGISVIVPIFNERHSLRELHQKIVKVMKKTHKSYEIIYIDDGSTDGSSEVLRSLKPAQIIVFRRNFGQTAALSAGFDQAKGEVVVTLDADLQNNPEDIPKLLMKLNEGYDLVSGWRKNRKDSYITRVLPSKIANRLIAFLSGVKLHDFGCTLKAYRREIINEVKLYGEMHRFIPAVVKLSGAKITEVVVSHSARMNDKTKYGVGKTFRVLLDLITVKFLLSYRTRPLHLFGGIGLLSSGAGSFVFFLLLYERLVLNQSLSTRPLFTLSIFLILVGVQFITIGLLAEMLMRIYFETQNKRTYYVKEIIGKEIRSR